MTDIKLTDYESAALGLIRDGRVDFFDEGYEEGTSYAFALSDSISANLEMSEHAAGGVISSLIQKGLILAAEYEGETSIAMSPLGIEAIERLVA